MNIEESVKKVIDLYYSGVSFKEALNKVEFENIEEAQQKDILEKIYNGLIKQTAILEISELIKNESLEIDKRNETLIDFINKAKEEFFETAKEVFRIENDFFPSYENLASEILDEIQLRVNALNWLQDKGHINITNEVDKHNNKLVNERGWETGKLYILAAWGR